MNTDKTLNSEFCNKVNYKLHNWQTKVLDSIEIDYVIIFLLKEKFVVEIDGYKYDISFGKNRKHEIGHSNSIYPSPWLLSGEFISKAFKIGKWYRVTDQDLTQEEIDKHIKDVEEQEEREYQEFLLDCAKRILEDKGIRTENMTIEEIVSKIKEIT